LWSPARCDFAEWNEKDTHMSLESSVKAERSGLVLTVIINRPHIRVDRALRMAPM
jgi:hypothetical protein